MSRASHNSCFPLAFLEGHCPSSSPAVTFLCLNPMTWNPSAPSNRAASSSSTSSRSCWRYSTILLCNSLPLGLFLGFGLCFSPGFLSRTLCMTGFHCLLQSKEGPLLLLMPLLHLMALLLEHFSIVLEKVGVGGGRHNNTKTRVKKLSFPFMYC